MKGQGLFDFAYTAVADGVPEYLFACLWMVLLSAEVLIFLKDVTLAIVCDLLPSQTEIKIQRTTGPLKYFPQPDTTTLLVEHVACI